MTLLRAKCLFVFGLVCILLAGFPACGGEEKMDPDVLVKVNGEPVRLRDMEMAWSNMPPEQRRLYQGPAGISQLLNEIITYKLMAQEAEQRRLDQDAEVQYRLETYRQNLLVSELLDRLVSDAEVYKYYQNNFLRGRIIKIAFPKDASKKRIDRAANEAGEVYSRLESGEKFAEMAKEHSDEDSASRGGDMGYVTHETINEMAGFMPAEALFALDEPGSFTEPVKGEDGYYIFQLMEPPGNLDPMGLTPRLKSNIERIKRLEAMTSFANEIKSREDHQVVRNQEALKNLFQKLVDAQRGAREPPAEQAGGTEAPAPGVSEPGPEMPAPAPKVPGPAQPPAPAQPGR